MRNLISILNKSQVLPAIYPHMLTRIRGREIRSGPGSMSKDPSFSSISKILLSGGTVCSSSSSIIALSMHDGTNPDRFGE